MDGGWRPMAHEKWFVDNPAAHDGSWSFFFEPASLAFFLGALALTLLWRAVASRVSPPELSFLAPLGRLAAWVPRLLAIHLGVSLVGLAVLDAYLAPNLTLEGVPGRGLIAFGEGALGVWLISGIALRPAALITLLLGPLAWIIAGPVAMLEAIDLLGVALFLALLPPGRDGFGAVRPTPELASKGIFALRVCAGAALVVLAFSEKFANPSLAGEFIHDYPAFNLFRTLGLDLDGAAFIRVAGAIELLFGFLVVSGAAPQIAVIVAGIPFNVTLFFLGRVELIGHLPLYGVMLALLVYGSSPEYARVVPSFPGVGEWLTRVRSRPLKGSYYSGSTGKA